MAKSTKKSTSLLRVDRLLSRILVGLMLGLLRFYRYFLSPWIGNQCRFYPTCSNYSASAYKEYGFIKGSVLTIIRIAKCNPWHKGGFDELPSKQAVTEQPATPKTNAPSCCATKHHPHN